MGYRAKREELISRYRVDTLRRIARDPSLGIVGVVIVSRRRRNRFPRFRASINGINPFDSRSLPRYVVAPCYCQAEIGGINSIVNGSSISAPAGWKFRIETGERTSHIRVNFCNAFDIDRMVIDELSTSRIGAAVSRTLDDYERRYRE